MDGIDTAFKHRASVYLGRLNILAIPSAGQSQLFCQPSMWNPTKLHKTGAFIDEDNIILAASYCVSKLLQLKGAVKDSMET